MKNRDLSILMITLFGELQKRELEELKEKKPKRYEGRMEERKRVAEAEGFCISFHEPQANLTLLKTAFTSLKHWQHQDCAASATGRRSPTFAA